MLLIALMVSWGLILSSRSGKPSWIRPSIRRKESLFLSPGLRPFGDSTADNWISIPAQSDIFWTHTCWTRCFGLRETCRGIQCLWNPSRSRRRSRLSYCPFLLNTWLQRNWDGCRHCAAPCSLFNKRDSWRVRGWIHVRPFCIVSRKMWGALQ